MSIRIACPECDTVFEPPSGVWSAQCPFCNHSSEVPHSVQSIDSSKIRRRIRRPPGWVATVLRHMPAWGSRVLFSSFALIMISLLLQAWTSAHSDQSKIFMMRALRQLQEARRQQNQTELLVAIDQTIASWTSDSANQVALDAGLDLKNLKNERKKLVRSRWSAEFGQIQALNTEPSKKLDLVGQLSDRAAKDSDLVELKQESDRYWARFRDQEVAGLIAKHRQLMQRGQSVEAAKSLETAIQWSTKARPEVAIDQRTRSEILELVKQLASRNGVVVNMEMVKTVFTELEFARSRILPVVERNLASKGFVVFRTDDSEFSRIFIESSGFRLNVKIDEHYGRPFEDTPHRTTIVNIEMNLLTNNQNLWLQTATTRTPRIPAKTAMGMSRLQLSTNSDEKVERKLSEAAWDGLSTPLNQSLQLLPAASSIAQL